MPFFSVTWHFNNAKSLQLCPTLCDPIDRSPPGSPVPGILQTRTLDWVAISFSNAWKSKVKVKSLSRVRPSVTPWTAAHQAPLSMGFSRQEYWRGCHCLLHTKCLANDNTAERRLNPHGNIKLRGMKSALTQFSTSVLSMPVENVLVANVVQ